MAMSTNYPDTTIFEDIVNGDKPGYIIAQTKLTAALLDNWPTGSITPWHTLIVTNQPIAHIIDVPKEAMLEVFNLAQKTSNKLKTVFQADSITRRVSGFEVQHFHLHLLPNTAEENMRDKFSLPLPLIDTIEINAKPSQESDGLQEYRPSTYSQRAYQLIISPSQMTSNQYWQLIKRYQRFRTNSSTGYERLAIMRIEKSGKCHRHIFPTNKSDVQVTRPWAQNNPDDMLLLQKKITTITS